VRADRLVAVLLLLQQRGRVTAREVADELETSERTARRDLEALSLAGIPVYSQQGRGGGWRLVGGARTDLSGLTAAEARALFLVAGPAAGAPAVRSALRKLVRALPEPFRVQAEAAAASVHVDAAGWGRADADLPRFLNPIQQAVIDGVQVELGYVDRGGRESTRTVHPLGVVSKGTAWYLVAGTDRGQRLFRIDRVTSAAPSEEPADRPADFDLAAEWRAIAEAIDHAPLEVRAVADADRIDLLRAILGSRLDVGGPGPDGVDIVVRGHSPRSVAGELAGAGSWVRIIEPEEVRVELARVARELTGLYGRPEPQS
jgi:predicted DNA-binding transcriptional regulator YafY